MYKQVIVIRSDLKMGKGKIASQASHASLSSYKRAGFLKRHKWEAEGSKKVVVKVGGEKTLMDIYEKAHAMNIPAALISDAGKTQVKSGTLTCLSLGPDKEEKIDKLTKDLKLL